MRVTAKKLVEAGAVMSCGKLRWFKKRWPSGCSVTLKNLEAAAVENTFMLSWFVYHYLDDCEFANELDDKRTELTSAWAGEVGKYYIDRAKTDTDRFIRGRQPQKQLIGILRMLKRSYEIARAAALIIIAH